MENAKPEKKNPLWVEKINTIIKEKEEGNSKKCKDICGSEEVANE